MSTHSIPRNDFNHRVGLVKKLLEPAQLHYDVFQTYLTEEQAKGELRTSLGPFLFD